MNNIFKNKGFTLIELLIVIAVSLLIATAAFPVFGNFYSTSQSHQAVIEVVQQLRISRQLAVSRFKNSAHGIFVEINPSNKDKMILYKGDSYATREQAYDRVIEFSSAITLSTTLAGNEVNFSKGLGIPSNLGTIVMDHQVEGIKRVRVKEYGIVEQF